MQETAQEAMARGIAPLLDEIREWPLRSIRADELEVGMAVKLCGEWYRFERLDHGRIVVTDEEHPERGEFFYGPTLDERFVWTGIF